MTIGTRFFIRTHLMVAALSVALPAVGYAQIGNGSSGLVAGTMAAGPNSVSSSREPSGPGLSRLPLTTPDRMPYDTTTGTPQPSNSPGTSAPPAVDGQAYGSAPEKWPYTISRVAVSGPPGPGTITQWVPVTSKPFRFTGKLWVRFGSSWFVCTASLIKRGVLVTAAHCVHNYGEGAGGFADEVRWYPANAGASGPWSYFSGLSWRVPTPYVNGTDTCSVTGVICNNDIATVTLATRSGQYAGQILGGFYNYGWNAWGFVLSPAFGNHWISDLTQLGYPVAIDNGEHMLRGSSFAKYIQSTGTNAKILKNYQLGSAMTGGSSGGPWLSNFGTTPGITGAASLGMFSSQNVVSAVTSWGYTTVGVNVQGASYFGQNAEFPNAAYGAYGAGNIGKLVQDTCTASPAYC
ncbi:MAG: hypothetical protein ABIK36_08790 [Pseudomonadota bacterium]